MKCREWTADGLRISAFEGAPHAPAVYVHMDREEALALADERWTVVALDGVDWNAGLTPWPAPAIFRGQPDFAGRAGEHLAVLTERVLPMVETALEPRRRLLAGYSLAGMLAVYAALTTDCFAEVASVSGSLWYPGFVDFVEKHSAAPLSAYFSVGDREKLGRNRVFHSIEDCTERVCTALSVRGTRTVFERNPGGHFDDPVGRMRKAFVWLTGREKNERSDSQ